MGVGRGRRLVQHFARFQQRHDLHRPVRGDLVGLQDHG